MLRSSTEASGTKNAAEAASPQGSTALSGGRRNPDERGIHSYIAMTIPQDEKKVRCRHERAPSMPMDAVERKGFHPSRLAARWREGWAFAHSASFLWQARNLRSANAHFAEPGPPIGDRCLADAQHRQRLEADATVSFPPLGTGQRSSDLCKCLVGD